LRKAFSLILVTLILCQSVFASGFKGHIEKTDTNQQEIEKKLFTGEVDVLDEKAVIKMTVSQVLSSGYTQEGDEFFAEISGDVVGDKGIIVPTGTIVHGVVRIIEDAKNMGRDGYVILDFDYIVTPDGREIPIEGSSTTKDHIVKGTAKAVAEHVGYTALGGVAGGLFALNLLGIEAAIASHGMTLAGGAAAGGVVGLGVAILRKGDGVLIQPGDELKIKITNKIELPVFSKDAFKQEELLCEGLDVRINSVIYEKDPFGVDNTITLSLGINNNSPKTFTTFDIALVNETKSAYFPSPFGDTSLWLRNIAPGDRVVGKLSFSVNDKKQKHWLVFYDRGTKKAVARISVDNAYQNIKDSKEKKVRTSRRT